MSEARGENKEEEGEGLGDRIRRKRKTQTEIIARQNEIIIRKKA